MTQVELWGDGPAPIVGVEDGKVTLICDASCGHRSLMTPDEAWDLGDDLLIAADRLMTSWEPAEIDLPPWMTKIQVAIAASNRLALVCEDHGAIHYPGMRLPVEEVVDLSRTHWTQQHSKEANDEERSNGGSDEEVRSSYEAGTPEADVHDPAA